MVAFVLLRYLRLKGPSWRVFEVTFATAYVVMFLIISIADHMRLAGIHRAASENPNLTTYHMQRLPFEEYATLYARNRTP